MTTFWLSALMASASLVSAITQAVQVPAPACTNDSLLRLLKSNQREFQPFCQKFLETVSHSVVTSVKTDTVTVTNVFSTTILNVETTRQTTYSTTIVATVTTTKGPGVKFVRRRERATTALSKYPAASISSACSCLRAPCKKKSTTKVAASTVTSKTTITLTKASTTTVKQTSTTTQVTTIVESATSTSTVDAPPPVSTLFYLTVLDTDGSTLYFKASEQLQDVNEALHASAGTIAAVPFRIDTQQRLYFGSVRFGGQVYASGHPAWFDGTLGGTPYVLFDDLQGIADAGQTTHKVSVNPTTRQVTFASSGGVTLTTLLCPSQSRSWLHVTVDDPLPSCRVVTVTAEYIF